MLSTAGKMVFLLLIAVTFCLLYRRVRLLIQLLGLGKTEERSDHLFERFRYAFRQILRGECTLKNVSRGDYAGIGHLLLFYGFLLFVIGYGFHIAEGFYEKLSPALLGALFNNLFFLVLDVAGLIVLACIVWAVVRRYLIKPDRLEATLEAGIVLVLISSLMLLNFVVEGFRILAEYQPFSHWAFVGIALSKLFRNMGLREKSPLFFWIFWWLHMGVIFGFGIYVLHSKHLHIVASPLNLLFRSMRPRGSLAEEKSFGVSTITQFSWKHLLDLYACAECGRCTANCPASLCGKPLRPRDIIHNLKKHLLMHGKDLLRRINGDASFIVGRVVTEGELWACTTCHACIDVCPVGIEHVEKIVSLRRHLVMEKAKFPREVSPVFRNLEIFGDVYGRGVSRKRDWMAGLSLKKIEDGSHADILYWAGCEGSLHDRNREVSRAIVKVIAGAGITVGVLERGEYCCGDPARRIGNEYLFQELARRNIEILDRHGITKIVTYCPHCYNTLKNEYSQLGGSFYVLHYTEYLAELLKQGKLKVRWPLEEKVTFHDPCYLGRVNGIYEAPREILASIPGLMSQEMNLSREKSFCCGAGGGRMWMHDDRPEQRMNILRAKGAVETGAEVVITACPYCLTMMEDGVKSLETENRVRVLDLSEILCRSVQ